MPETNSNLCSADIKSGGFMEKLPFIGWRMEKGCEDFIKSEALNIIAWQEVNGGALPNTINRHTNLGLATTLKQIAAAAPEGSVQKKRAEELALHFESKYK